VTEPFRDPPAWVVALVWIVGIALVLVPLLNVRGCL
jgi:hypothetical protein